MQSTESLRQFFSASFHEDCLLDDPDWESIARRFRRDAGVEMSRGIAAEIRQLLAESTSDDALGEHLFRELGCYYSPRPDLNGPSFSAWLASVGSALEN